MAVSIRTRAHAETLGDDVLKLWDEHAANRTAARATVKLRSGKGLAGQSAAEQRFEDRYLMPMVLNREITRYLFIGRSRKAWSFRVAGRKTYCPDYAVWLLGDSEPSVFIEVKGNFHGKGLRVHVVAGRYADSLTRLEVVAEREPRVFLLAEYQGREGWRITRIAGAGDGVEIGGVFGGVG